MWRILLVVLAACGVPPLPIDRSKLVDGPASWQAAEDSTCAEFSIGDCPPVYWYGPEALNCEGGAGWFVDGTCVAGLQGSDGILVAVVDAASRPSATTLVHELAHWRWGDPSHSSFPVWGSLADGTVDDHAAGSRVGIQNADLYSAGM